MATEREAFEDAMVDLTGEELGSAAHYLRWLRGGGAPPWWPDCVVQHGLRGRRPDLYDARVMLAMELDLALGLLAVARIDVGEFPEKDEERTRNEKVLQRAVPNGWGVEVGGYADDGVIHWGDDRPDFIDLMEMRAPDLRSGAILEIGSTGAHKTILHLRQGGALARWPYESTYLWIFELRHIHGKSGEWDELVARRTQTPLPGPAIVCVGASLEMGLDLAPYRPAIPDRASHES